MLRTERRRIKMLKRASESRALSRKAGESVCPSSHLSSLINQLHCGNEGKNPFPQQIVQNLGSKLVLPEKYNPLYVQGVIFTSVDV